MLKFRQKVRVYFVFNLNLKRPWAIRRRLAWSLAAVNIFGTVVFSTLAYQASRQATLADIDDILCAAAEGVRSIVPPIIVDQAEGVERTEPLYTETYHSAHESLERYVEAARLEFLYAIVIRKDGSAYELVSNLSPEQQAARVDPMQEILLKPYEDLSPVMIEAAKTGQRSIDVAEDEYGHFRSCLVPVTSAAGTVTLFGADLEISEVNQRLLRDLITNVGIGFMVLVGTLFVIRAVSNSMSRDVSKVVSETEAVSRLSFMPDEQRLSSTTLEVDQLFGALYDMKNGLKAFSKYVPTSVIKRVLATGRAEIGGERRELSLLMTDVTDFTTISEQLDAEKVMMVMSEYFGNVVAPILDMQGTLDKYVGDAIFAYWNAPNAQPDHAALCCKAALKSREASTRLAEQWKQQGLFPWYTRFGLHAGETVFGNVGAPDRMDFTVIGSSVNLASRIEGLNKYYGTEILASQRLRELARDQFVFRSIDRVMPKGAIYDFEIYELLGETADFTGNTTALDYLTLWENAYGLYKQRKWVEAFEAFQRLSQTQPSDKVAALYVKRCQDFMQTPPAASWDGIQRFDSK
ncbi:MAG: adenylate/guanylate cyclase domain-containing protein [Rhodospirillaceae bacterium]|nr:adenylate/guanylate cyclase domain-containing protein [Rhodospirillaceae bacterium]